MLVARVLEKRHVIGGAASAGYGVVFDHAVSEPFRELVEIDFEYRLSGKVVRVFQRKSVFDGSGIRIRERESSFELRHRLRRRRRRRRRIGGTEESVE